MPATLAPAPTTAGRTAATTAIRTAAGGTRIPMGWEEYVAFQAADAERWFEWADGEATEMPRVTYEHATLRANLTGLLWAAARRGGGGAGGVRVLAESLRIRTGAGTGRYADVPVVVGRPRFLPHPEGRRLDLLNPRVLFEVLSDGTADADEGEKLDEYAATESVTDYVLVDSRRTRVVHRTRADAAAPWEVRTLEDAADVPDLPALGLRVTLADLYDGLDLPGA